MKDTLIHFLVTFIIGIVIGLLGYHFLLTPEVKPIETIEVIRIETDTVEVEKPIYITKWKTKLDTVYLENENLFFTAEADTTFEDSSFTANIVYYSPIKLSPLGWFDFSVKTKDKYVTIYKDRTITHTVEVQESWFKRHFGVSAGIGVYYGLESQKLDLGIGLQWSYKF